MSFILSFCPIKNDSASDEENLGIQFEELEYLLQPNFLSLKASFRKCKKELKDEDKYAQSSSKCQELRNDQNMKAVMVDYETDIIDIEQNIFASPVKMKLIFYFIDH